MHEILHELNSEYTVPDCQLAERYFADIYLFGPDFLRGQIKRSYLYVLPNTPEDQADINSLEMFERLSVQNYIEQKRQDFDLESDIHAQSIVEKMVEMLSIAQGDRSFTVTTLCGGKPKEFEIVHTDLDASLRLLELLGRNVLVNAFVDGATYTGEQEIQKLREIRDDYLSRIKTYGQ